MCSTARLSRATCRSRGRAPLLLLLAACAGVGMLATLWWFQRNRVVEGRPAGDVGRSDAALLVAPMDARADGPHDGARGATAGGTGRIAQTVPDQVPAEADPGRFAVLVLEGQPPKPVARAAVRLLALGAPKSRAGRLTVAMARHRLFEPLQSAESDGSGLAWFDRDPKGLAVEAEVDGNWGWLALPEAPPSDAPLELWVEPDRSVRVLVVDRTTGQPRPGVELQFDHYYDEGARADTCDWAVSDGEGRAHFEHLGQFLDGYWAHTDFFVVAAAGDWTGDTSARLDMGVLHGEVVLQVDEFAELRVRVLDALGEPYLGGGELSVAQWKRTRDGNSWELGDFPQTAELLRGEARLAQLPVNARVRVDARPDAGPPVTLDHVDLGGAGQTTDALLRLPAQTSRWLVRPIASDGASLVGGLFSIHNMSIEVREGAEPLAINPYSLGVEVGTPLAFPVQCRNNGLGWAGTLRVPGNLAPGDVDLGVVVLEPLPVAFAGQVVDASGEGLADAWLRFHWRDTESDSGNGPDFKTDGSGNFALSHFTAVHRPDPESRRYALTVQRAGYVEKLFSGLRPGTSDLRLELAGAGQIRGTVLLDEPWMRDFIGVECKTDAGVLVSRAHIERRGDLAVWSLPPGMYTVTFTMEAEAEPLMRVAGVQVLAGEITRDPRLQGLDLRGRVGHLPVEVVDTMGTPIPSASGRLLGAGVEQWGEEVGADAKGRLHFFAQRAPAQVFVGAPGFQSVLTPLADGGTRVVLHSAREVLVHWVDLPTEWPAGFDVKVTGRSVGVGQPDRSHPVSIAATLESAESQPFDGGDALELTVHLRKGQIGGPSPNRALPPLRFPIPASALRTTIAVPFPTAEWAAFLERLGGR